MGKSEAGEPMNILDPQGPIAAADKMILINSIAIMLAIVVPTIVAIFAFALVFPQIQHQGLLLARTGSIRGGSSSWCGRYRP